MSATRTTPIVLVAVLATLATVALARGADRTLTKAQVIARGSAICKAGERKVNALPQIRSANPFASTAPKGDKERAIVFIAGYASALEGVRVGLARLAPPTQDRELFETFVADLRPTVAAFRAGHRAALAGRYALAMSKVQRGFALFAKASKNTKAYGFPKGVCQAGSS